MSKNEGKKLGFPGESQWNKMKISGNFKADMVKLYENQRGAINKMKIYLGTCLLWKVKQ